MTAPRLSPAAWQRVQRALVDAWAAIPLKARQRMEPAPQVLIVKSIRGEGPDKRVYGKYDPGRNQVRIAWRHARQLADDLLAVLLMHELLHAALWFDPRTRDRWHDEALVNRLVRRLGFDIDALRAAAGCE